MTLYEIDQAILEALEAGTDPETGELVNFEALEALTIAREQKVENTVLYYKNLIADAKAIKEEVDALTRRKRAMEARAERIKRYLELSLAGQVFESARCKVSWRKSTALNIEDEAAFRSWIEAHGLESEWMRYKEPEFDKKAITDAIKTGAPVPVCVALVERKGMVVK